jgi:hypothetical protein
MGFPIDCVVDASGERRVDENLLCPLCLDVLDDPVSGGCGHAACRECLGQHLSNQSDCPQCRAALSENALVPNVIVRSMVSELRCVCPNNPIPEEPAAKRARGEAGAVDVNVCNWQGKCETLAAHRATCPREIVPCPMHEMGCTARIRRCGLAAHVADAASHLQLVCTAFGSAKEKSEAQEREIATLKRQMGETLRLLNSTSEMTISLTLKSNRMQSLLDEMMQVELFMEEQDVQMLEEKGFIESKRYTIAGRDWILRAEKQGHYFVLLLIIEEGYNCTVNATFYDEKGTYKKKETITFNNAEDRAEDAEDAEDGWCRGVKLCTWLQFKRIEPKQFTCSFPFAASD